MLCRSPFQPLMPLLPAFRSAHKLEQGYQEKLSSNCDSNKIPHRKVIRTSVWFHKHDCGQALHQIRNSIVLGHLSLRSSRLGQASVKVGAASNANKHATFRASNRFVFQASQTDPIPSHLKSTFTQLKKSFQMGAHLLAA